MKPEEQRIAIAKACGWKKKYSSTYDKKCWYNELGTKVAPTQDQLPDYLNDLNAIRQALLTLPPDAPWNYYLSQVIWEENQSRLVTDMDRAQATAAQQARAFLEIKKLWKHE